MAESSQFGLLDLSLGSVGLSRAISLETLSELQADLPSKKAAMRHETRVALACTVTQCLRRYLETEWMRPSFHHSDIVFIPQRDGDNLLNILPPALRIPHPSATVTSLKEGYTCTRVKALGLFLAELAPFRSLGSKRVRDTIKVSITEDTSEKVKKRTNLSCRSAVEARLEWEHSDFLNPEAQKIFDKSVVQQLKGTLVAKNIYPHHLHAREKKRKTPTTPQFRACEVFDRIARNQADAQRMCQKVCIVEHRKEDASTRWISDMQQSIGAKFPESDKHKPVPQARVAILDTGADLNNPLFNSFRDRITSKMNFTDQNEEDITDLDGHGTHVLHTLLKSNECTEVGIAKVTRAQKLKTENWEFVKKVCNSLEARNT